MSPQNQDYDHLIHWCVVTPNTLTKDVLQMGQSLSNGYILVVDTEQITGIFAKQNVIDAIQANLQISQAIAPVIDSPLEIPTDTADLTVAALLASIVPPIQDKTVGWLASLSRCKPQEIKVQSSEQVSFQALSNLLLVVHQNTEQKSLLSQQMQLQAQREQTLNRVIQAIRNSLDLSTIFSTAASELGKLLQADRMDIVQYLPEREIWLNVSDYRRDPTAPSALGLEIPDADNLIAAQLKQLQFVRIDNADSCTDEINQKFAQQFPGSWLIIPLEMDVDTLGISQSTVWGAVSGIREGPPYRWEDWEVDLFRTVVNQLAIAIQQSQLYQQVQQLNSDLERQVAERTAQLQQALGYGNLLQRITDRVRDSLDEGQILQTVANELLEALETSSCDTGLYDLEQRTSTICCEAIRSNVRSLTNHVFSMDYCPEVYEQLLTGQPLQFCWLEVPVQCLRSPDLKFSILACPLIDDQGVIGDMWLCKPADECFKDTETQLVQQVANQCAIAVRQSRLYQATQRQVKALEQLNQLKNDFLNTISHELRTPLASIQTAALMLEISFRETGLLLSPEHPISRYFQILQEECQRELTLINNLLHLAHLDAQSDPLILSTLDLCSWLSHQIEPFLERAQKQQQQFHLNCSANLPPLTTDFTYMGRIISELLNNACKYTPAQETITVSVQAIESNVDKNRGIKNAVFQISVSNSGVEIPAEELNRIFDRFYRIPSNDPWKHSGTGLGLALVKKLVENLSGYITVTSHQGETRFTVEVQSLNS